jgi:hypothetical protein
MLHRSNYESFQVNVIIGGLRINASAAGGGDPAVWVVTR